MQCALPAYGVRDGENFEPSPEQSRFHDLAQKYVYARGGAGSGKSHAGCREFMVRIFENYSARRQKKGFSKKGAGVLYIAAAPTVALTQAGPWQHITGWLEEFQIQNGFSLVKKCQLTWPRRYTLITGDVIMFVNMQSPQQFAGWSIGGFWLDEVELAADPMSVWVAANNRLRDNRVSTFGLATSTPKAGASLAMFFRDRIADGHTEYAEVVMPSASNPSLDPAYIESMLASMSDREAQMMVYGNIVAMAGTIFGNEYDASESIAWGWKWHGAPRSDRQYFLFIDWPPSAVCLLVEFDPKTGLYIVFDEVITDGQQINMFCSTIADACEQRWGIRRDHIDGVYCDAQPPEGRQMAYSKRFWPGRVHFRTVRGSRRDKESGIETVRWCLNCQGERRLTFARRLRTSKSVRGVLKSLENYAETERVVDGQLIRTGKVRQDSPYSHANDAIRYGLWIREGHRRFWDANAAIREGGQRAA